MIISGATTNSPLNLSTLANRSDAKSNIHAQRTSEDSVSISSGARSELEKYAAYPEWVGNYLPKVNKLNNPDVYNVGYAKWESDFRDVYRNELKEYNTLFNSHFNDSKAEHNIVSRDDYYNEVIVGGTQELAFKQTFEQKMHDDPRVQDLMARLGISIS